MVITDTTNIDRVFKNARELAYAGKYSWARNYCRKILEYNPGYNDVHVFLGRTYAWEKNYEMARAEYSSILLEKENDIEALTAMIELEQWAGNPAIAAQYMQMAINYYPNNLDLLLKKAEMDMKQNKKQEASMTLRKALAINPGNKQAQRMMDEIDGRKYRNSFLIHYLMDAFDHKAPQHFGNIDYNRNFRFGTVILRLNAAERFNRRGYQPELEMYLHFTKGTYLNLIGAYSEHSIFPKERYGAEIFQRIPAGFELSAGLRIQKFERTSTVYTGSLSNYFRDWWFNVRAFITPKTDSTSTTQQLKNSSVTVLMSIRRYLSDADNYFGIRLGQGRSPDENRSLDIATQLLSYQGGIEFQFGLTETFFIRGISILAIETPRPDVHTQRFTNGLTLKKVF